MAENATTEGARVSRMAELRARVHELDAEIMLIGSKDILSEAEEERYDELNAMRDEVFPEFEKLQARAERIESIKKTTHREMHGTPEYRTPVEELLSKDVRKLDHKVARDAALRILSDRDQAYTLETHQQDHVERLVRTDPEIAKRLLVTENDAYRSAWHNYMMNGPSAIYTDEQRQALLRWNEFRNQSTTTTAGGFAIPVFIDPSVILTDQETDNPFLTLCRQVQVPGTQWKGVSAAGVTWSFDAEGVEVSDDAVTVAQPVVDVLTARGFIPFTLEIGETWPEFQSEMGRLLGEGYNEILVDKFTRGSGTGEPTGIITKLDATSASEVRLTTAGQFGQEDIYKVWKALPQKYRNKASFLMNVDTNNRIRQFGTANVFHAYTENLPAAFADMLFGRQVRESPYFTDFTSTTGPQNVLVVGDFSNMVIARGRGMQVELVPHLLSLTTNLPNGQRGWFAHARVGSNVVNTAGFRLLNQT